MRGQAGEALDLLAELNRAGADPAVVLADLLDLVHFVTRIKILPATADDAGVADTERARAKDMASRLSMPVLSRAWQMLLKGLGEVRAAPSDSHAAEMILVRIAYAADMPTPGELVAQMQPGRTPSTPAPRPAGGGGAGLAMRAEAAPVSAAAPAPDNVPRSFDDAVKLFAEKREGILYSHSEERRASGALRTGPDRAAPRCEGALHVASRHREAAHRLDGAALGGRRLERARRADDRRGSRSRRSRRAGPMR